MVRSSTLGTVGTVSGQSGSQERAGLQRPTRRFVMGGLAAALLAMMPLSSPDAQAVRFWDNTVPNNNNWGASLSCGTFCLNTNWVGGFTFVNPGDSVRFLSTLANSGSGLISNNDLAGRSIQSITFDSGRNSTTVGGDFIEYTGDGSTYNRGIINNSTSTMFINAGVRLRGDVGIHTFGRVVVNGLITRTFTFDNINKTGSGTLVLNNTNLFGNSFNGTNIVDGTVQIFSDRNLGRTDGFIQFNGNNSRLLSTGADVVMNRRTYINSSGPNSGGTFDVSGSANTLTQNGLITGLGTLYKQGSGTLVLNNNNDYTGGTFIDNGTVQISKDRDLGRAGVGHILTFEGGTLRTTNAGSIFIDRNTFVGSTGGTFDVTAGNVTLRAPISNRFTGISGRLTKTGTGTLFIDGTNTYSGGTIINQGAIDIDKDSNLGAASGALTFSGSGGRLQTNNSFTSFRTINLNASGTIDVIGSSTTVDHDGAINGSGLLFKDGDGTLALGGAANGFTGSTVVLDGTLRLDLSNRISNGTGFGGLYVQSGATFDLNNQVETVGFLSDWSGTGGSVDLGGGALTLDTKFSASASVTFSGVITGSGGSGFDDALRKKGTGTQVLSGANTYTGDTLVEEGTLKIGTGGSLSSKTDLFVYDGATFDLGGQNIIVDGLNGRFGTDGTDGTGGSVVLGGGTLTVGAFGSATTYSSLGNNSYFNGVISGSGGVSKIGTGTQTLGGQNTYNGNTILAGGTLRLGDDNAIPDGSALLFHSSTAVFDVNGHSETIRYLHNQIGSGGFVELGTGGALTLNADTAVNARFSGNISGDGSLTKAGAGTQTLTGNNDYTGGTTVSGGRLIGDSDSLQGDITNNANVTFSQTFGGTYAGIMSGSGTLRVTGGSKLTLTGANSYEGGTIIDGGRVQVEGDGNLGASSGTLTLINGRLDVAAAPFTTVTMNRNTTLTGDNSISVAGVNRTLTLEGDVSGTGGLTKLFAGTVRLAGNNAYEGETVINRGTLALSGDGEFKSSQVTVETQGRLDLTGRTSLDPLSSQLVNDGQINNFGLRQELAGDLINQGVVNGGSAGLVLAGDVTGAGNYLGDIEFTKSFGPGNSPALINGQNVTFGASNLLLMELGGLGRGSQYDAFDISGALTFGGTLDVSYINGLGASIALNDTFDLFNFNPFQASGTFASIVLPTLMSGWMWDITGLYTEGVIFVAEAVIGEGVPGPGAVFILVIGLAGLRVVRKRADQ